jgi:Tol biopolymer transport system component
VAGRVGWGSTIFPIQGQSMFFRLRLFSRLRKSLWSPRRSRSLRLEPLESRELLNAAPTDILLPQSHILEYEPAGTAIGRFSTVDPDRFNSFTYSLVPGPGSTDNTAFRIGELGDLLTGSTFDAQAQSNYNLRVRSTDQGGLWLEKCFTVTVDSLSERRVDLVSTAMLRSTGDDLCNDPGITADGRYVVFSSYASDLVLGDTNGRFDVFVNDLRSGAVTRVSTNSSGLQGDGDAFGPSISADGRYVTFESYATNMVGDDTNGKADIFLKDLVSGLTTRVSTTDAGGEGDGNCYGDSISADGRYLAFSSEATNLIGDDTNACADTFVKDLFSGHITRVSTTDSGAETNGGSYVQGISADGRYLAFNSSATNLVAGDTNAVTDIFVKDRISGATVRVSTDSGGLQANGGSSHASLSADGRYAIFASDASNLVADDTNDRTDIFRKDLASGVTLRVSTDSSGGEGDHDSWNPSSISADGRFVAFQSDANNLVPDDDNPDSDIFVKDTVSGITTEVSINTAPDQFGWSYLPSISGDGRYLAFASKGGRLGAGDTNGECDIYVRDLSTGLTILVSPRNGALSPTTASGDCGRAAPSISADGRYVAFGSGAIDLVPPESPFANWWTDIFVKDLASGQTMWVSTDSAGVGGNYYSYECEISGDGRYVVFSSDASNLVPDDTNAVRDVFMKDMVSGATVRVSTDSLGVQRAGSSSEPSLSADGRYVAFTSYTTTQVAGYTFEEQGVLRKDTVSGITTLVSADRSGVPGDGYSGSPSISADGRYVAFGSSARNLVPGDTNATSDVFVKDMLSGAITRVNTDSAGTQTNSFASDPSISADGRYVTFCSYSLGQSGPPEVRTVSLIAKDLWSGATTSVTTGIPELSSWLQTSSLSGDGRYVAFANDAADVVPGDTNQQSDVFILDMLGGSTARVSVDRFGQQANGRSYFQSISADGQYVAFCSEATNLHPWDSAPSVDVLRVTNPFANHTPLGISLAGSVSEDAAAGTVVGTLHTTDLDAGQTFVYTLIDSAGGRFRIVGDQLVVDDAALLDYDTDASHTIRVRTTDLAGTGLSLQQDLAVHVTDVHDFESPALFDPASSFFHLRCSNVSGEADYSFGYGQPHGGWTVLTGDWDGDGQAGVGLYAPESSAFYLSNAYQTGFAEYTFGFGEPGGDWIPLVGDWDGDGRSGVGLYDPHTSTFYLTDTLQTGFATHTFGYGEPGGRWTPLVGDWNGDGRTGVGLYNPHASTFYLTDTLQTGFAEHTFGFGEPNAGWQPLVGDWNGDRSAGVGLYARRTSTFYLTNTFISGFAEHTFGYGDPRGGWMPLVGDWDGDRSDGVGLYAPASSTFYLTDTLTGGYAEYTVGFGEPKAGWKPLVGCWGAPPEDRSLANRYAMQENQRSPGESSPPTPAAVDQIDLAQVADLAQRVILPDHAS